MSKPRSDVLLFRRAATQRFEDGEWLLASGRTTGAVYLAGYSVECELKALVLSILPEHKRKQILKLFVGAKAHDFDWLLRLYDEHGGPQVPWEIQQEFVNINSWSTDLRYQPRMTPRSHAEDFFEATTTILEWAEGRL